MNLIVHYPTSSKSKEELARRVSEIHSRAVVNYISNLPIANQEKLLYFQKIVSTIQ